MTDVLLIDPSLFTPAYDSYLVSGIKETGCRVDWLGSKDIWGMLKGYPEQPREYFYRATNKMFGTSRSPFRQGFKLADHISGMTSLSSYAKKENAQILHFQWSAVPEVDHYYWSFYKKQGYRLVYTVHNLWPHKQGRNDHKKYLRLYRLADQLIVHCRETSNGLAEKFGIDEGKIQTIAMPALPLPATGGPSGTVIKEQLGLASNRIALCFGFIEEYKGFDLAIEALASAANKIPKDVVLVIAGRDDAGWTRRLNGLIAEKNLQKRVVLKLGFMEQAYLKALIEASGVCLFPYRRISQSGALLTAMAEGRAVVGFDVGGISEVIENGKNGIVVPSGDVKALGETMVALFSSDEKIWEMGKASLELVANKYSFIATGQATHKVYQSMLT
ncbi:glycosyltransferase family 4 protein [candidate division TA06 bacterium]|nr:glycosyltransferase family 4 protein [candidate division TA06 bacterium]